MRQRSPAGKQVGEVFGQRSLKVHFLAGGGMAETECAGMKSLSRTSLKTMLYELAVSPGGGAAQNLIAAVTGIVEQRMSE